VRLAALLFFIVASTHYLGDHLAKLYVHAEQAAKAWFYILRGYEGVALFCLVGALCLRAKAATTIAAVCLWGATEEAMTSICRLTKPISEAPRVLPFSGLCGDDYYLAGCFAALVIGAIILDLGRKS
jgi:hypothetical protein